MKAILLAMTIWAHGAGGAVVEHHAWPIRPAQQIVTVDFPIVFHPSGLVGREREVFLAWHTRWWNSLKQTPTPGITMKLLSNVLYAPAGYSFAGPPTLDQSEQHS